MITGIDMVVLLSSGELTHRYRWLLRRLRLKPVATEIVSTMCVAPRAWSLSQLASYIDASKSSTRLNIDTLVEGGVVTLGEDGWYIASETRQVIYEARRDIWLVSLGWKTGLDPATIELCGRFAALDTDLLRSVSFSPIIPAPDAAEMAALLKTREPPL